MKKIGANIKFNVTTVSNSYIKQKSNIIRIQISKKLATIKNLINANEKEIATIMNNFFNNITKNLHSKSSKRYTTKDMNSIVSEFDDHKY